MLTEQHLGRRFLFYRSYGLLDIDSFRGVNNQSVKPSTSSTYGNTYLPMGKNEK